MITPKLGIRARKMITGQSPYYPDTPFGHRLRFLFCGANNSEIARTLNVHNSTVHTWMKTGRVPPKKLKLITDYTGARAEWLKDRRAPIFNDSHLSSETVAARINLLISDQLQFVHSDYCCDYTSALTVHDQFISKERPLKEIYKEALSRQLKRFGLGGNSLPEGTLAAAAISLASVEIFEQYLHARIQRHTSFTLEEQEAIIDEAQRRYAKSDFKEAWKLWLTLMPYLDSPRVPGPWEIIYQPLPAPARVRIPAPRKSTEQQPRLKRQVTAREKKMKPHLPDTPFGARVRSLFGGATDGEIGEALGLSESVITTALTSSPVKLRVLRKLVAHTGRDASWLRTGQKPDADKGFLRRLSPALHRKDDRKRY